MITSNLLLTSDKEYVFDSEIYVTNGATLTIQAGTRKTGLG